MKVLTSTAALLMATSTAAFAGGIAEPVAVAPVAAPVAVVAPAPSTDWSGFYAGGSIGTGSLSFEDVDDSDTDLSSYGIHAGYLYDLGAVVLGAEGEYSVLDIDGSGDETDSTVARLKGIVGYDAGQFLPYATAGGAQLSIDEGGESESSNGYFYGAGVMFKATDRITVGAEVLQHRFDDIFETGANADVTTGALKVSFTF